MTGMTDIHQHVLYGIDDGPMNADLMHEMLRQAHEQGIERVAATPHACPGIRPFDMGMYNERLREAQEYCDANALGIEMVSGAEVAWTYNTVDALRQGRVPTLGGTDRVLIELWEKVSWTEVKQAARQLLRAGFTPVFAHIERYRYFVWQPKQAQAFREEFGVEFQVNASSILGQAGPMQRRFIRIMLDEQALDAVATDAHDCAGRRICLAEAYDELERRCGTEYAGRLVNFGGVKR